MLPENKPELRRLVIFGVVGTINTAICYVVFAVLWYWADWHYDLALVADYVFGAALGYALHRLATFGDRKDLRQAFSKYALSLVITFLLNLVILDWMVRAAGIDPLTAQAIATVAVTLVSYVMSTAWVFRSYPQTVDSSAGASPGKQIVA